jgi:hypothetical protein
MPRSFFAWKPVVVQLVTLALTMNTQRLLASTTSAQTLNSFGSASSGVNTPSALEASRNRSGGRLRVMTADRSHPLRPGKEPGSRHGSKGDMAMMMSPGGSSQGSRHGSKPDLTPGTLSLGSRNGSKAELNGAAVGQDSVSPPPGLARSLADRSAGVDTRSFSEMTGRERVAALCSALPLEHAEKYPLLADLMEGFIDKGLMADNDATSPLKNDSTNKAAAIEEIIVDMVEMAAACVAGGRHGREADIAGARCRRLQMRGGAFLGGTRAHGRLR